MGSLTPPSALSQSGGWFAWIPDALKAIRNPMIFNACAILAMSALVYGGIRLDFNWFRGVFLGVAVLFVIGVTSWLNFFAWRNPRFLAYGPDEYLRESELEHERKMADRAAAGSGPPLVGPQPAMPGSEPPAALETPPPAQDDARTKGHAKRGPVRATSSGPPLVSGC